MINTAHISEASRLAKSALGLIVVWWLHGVAARVALAAIGIGGFGVYFLLERLGAGSGVSVFAAVIGGLVVLLLIGAIREYPDEE